MMKIDWQKNNGLIAAIVQDADSGLVLMLGYMSKESFKKTLSTKKVWFYSRSKKRLWRKGETSGNELAVVRLRIDCDGDALLIAARPRGPTCHTGKRSCFDNGVSAHKPGLKALEDLCAIIQNRKDTMPRASYTAGLFRAGIKKISNKIVEEAGEVFMAARKESKQRLVEESVDLLYHLFVLLVEKKISLTALIAEMNRRRK